MLSRTGLDLKQPAADQSASADESDDSSNIGVAATANDIFLDRDSARVIVVDDDPEILQLVGKMVALLGYRCTTAVDALDALLYVKKIYYDLIITDYDMPFMNGFQLAEQVKRMNSSIKVIVMTGHCEAVLDGGKIESTNVDGLLFKPFNLQAMREKIEEVFHFCLNSETPSGTRSTKRI